VLINWDYGAGGIWMVLSREQMSAPAPPGRWTGTPPPGHASGPRPRAWSDRLPGGLLDELQDWNDGWDHPDADVAALQERGRVLAIRVQEELGTEGWEVLYMMKGRVHRVQPPGSWPHESWRQELLGYPPGKRGEAGERG